MASGPHLLLLESAASHPTLGRYSFVTADPFHWLRSRGGRVMEGEEGSRLADPIARLQEGLEQWRVEAIADLPPFQGGAAGLFGYDLYHHIERLPRPRCDEF